MWKHRVTEHLESCHPLGHLSLVSRSSPWLPSSLSWINAEDMTQTKRRSCYPSRRRYSPASPYHLRTRTTFTRRRYKNQTENDKTKGLKRTKKEQGMGHGERQKGEEKTKQEKRKRKKEKKKRKKQNSKGARAVLLTTRRHHQADGQLSPLYPPSPSFSSFGAACVKLCGLPPSQVRNIRLCCLV